MAQSMGIGPNDTVSLGISQRSVIQNPGGATNGGSLSPQKRQKQASSSSSKAVAAKASKTSSSGAVEASVDPASASNSTDTSAMDPATTDAASTDPASADSAPAASTDSGAASSPSSSTDASTAATTQPPASGQQGSNTTPQNPAATQLLLSPTFTPINQRTVLDMTNSRVAVTVNSLDGEFIVTMGKAGAQNQVQAQPGALASSTPSTQNNANGLTPPAKRQSTQTQSQGGLLVTMADLQALVAQQKSAGMLPVIEMMSEVMEASQSLSGSSSLRSKRMGPLRMPPAV